MRAIHALGFLMVIGCSENEDGAPRVPDAGEDSAVPSGGRTGSGGRSSGGITSSGGASSSGGIATSGGASNSGGAENSGGVSSDGGPGDSGNLMCNTLVLDGPRVVPEQRTGTPPAALGGALPEGHFVLTAYELYGDTDPTGPIRATYEITDNVVQYVFESEGFPRDHYTYTLTSNGTKVTKELHCPRTATEINDYTATADEMTFQRTSARGGVSVWHVTRAP